MPRAPRVDRAQRRNRAKFASDDGWPVVLGGYRELVGGLPGQPE